MCTSIQNPVLMRIVYVMVLPIIIPLCLNSLIIMFKLMEKLFFLLILSISLASCKSVGVRVQGRSTILRNDTIRTTYEVAKPLNQVINVDY